MTKGGCDFVISTFVHRNASGTLATLASADEDLFCGLTLR